MPYKLSAVLYGHKSDVRGSCVTEHDHIVSCSRDKTAKLWKPNGHNTGFTEVQTFTGHKNFVTSVCAVPANDVYPSGLILTGGNDNVILAYTPDLSTPIFKLIGHENTVCKIVNGLETNVVLSASWDKSVKIWQLSQQSSTCVLSIGNHQAAVWTVLYARKDLIITGSADKNIRFFTSTGSLLKTLTGHTDCVRDLAKLNDNEILSCANDATVKRWSLNTGECIETLFGHPNFIYSLYVQGNMFVTAGEDRCLMIWSDGDQEKLVLPAQSVWTVSVLSNTDVVVGTSDGVIRIFSAFKDRQAGEDTQALFESEVTALNAEVDKLIGGVKVSDLPGPEVLQDPGTKEAQTRMVREDGEVNCYSWSVADQKWNKMGNVVSGSGGTQETSGRVLYEGKEYDFVFNVDIEDGKPALKLPYNKAEDPWFVAQAFIHKNDLPQVYLEQVANFIITNSKQNNAPIAPQAPEFADPFTGGCRYVPSGGSTTTGGSTADPFTGANRYVPGASAPPSGGSGADPFTGTNRYVPMDVSHSEPSKNSFFPQTSYIRFDQANVSQILDKLKAFNSTLEDGSLKFSDTELENVTQLCNPTSSNFPIQTVETLKKLLNWPKACIFPVLDVLRLAVRSGGVNSALCSDKYIFGYLKDNLQSDSPIANQMLSLRTLCNMLTHGAGEQLIFSHKDFVVETIGSFRDLSNKSLQMALVTLALNMATLFYKNKDLESQSVMLLNLITIFPDLTETEAIFRALVTLGTILTQSTELASCIDSNLKQLITNCSSSGLEKVKNCSTCVLSLIT